MAVQNKEQPKQKPGTELATRKPQLPSKYAAMGVVRKNIEELEAFIKYALLEQGIDYGIVPGTKKPMLFKPGLEQLCNYYHLVPDQEVDDTGTDFERGVFRYRVTTNGYEVDPTTGVKIPKGQGRGSCSSLEGKYRWRWLKYYNLPSEVPRTPEGKVDTKMAVDYWRTKYGDNAVKYVSFGRDKGGEWQYRVENPDPHDLENTILKQACTRSLRAWVILVTGADRCFFDEKEAEKLGFKRMLDDDDFTKQGEVIEGEFKEVAAEEPVKNVDKSTGEIKDEPPAEAKAEPKKTTNKNVMPWHEFIKEVQSCCIKLGWTVGKLGFSKDGNELLKLMEHSYINVHDLKEISEVNRSHFVSQLYDIVADRTDQVKPVQAASASQEKSQSTLL